MQFVLVALKNRLIETVFFKYPQCRFWLRNKNIIISYDVTSGSEITPCNKIDKPLVVYKFINVMTSIFTLSKRWTIIGVFK